MNDTPQDAITPSTPSPDAEPVAPPVSPPSGGGGKPKESSGVKLKVIALSAALCGMVFGAVVEMFVQGALESTGWFGPTLDTVIEEQLANFSAIQDKLAAIEAATTDDERQRLTGELETLLKEQEALTARTHDELRASAEQIEELRAAALKEQGTASGVDFWLSAGESVSVGSRENVFAVNRIYGGDVFVNMSGASARLKPGEFVEAKVGDEVYKVFYRMAPKRGEAQRAGFDLVRPGE
jgi:hypothetical protein